MPWTDAVADKDDDVLAVEVLDEDDDDDDGDR